MATEFLKHTHLKALKNPAQSILTLKKDCMVAEALEKFAKGQVYSMPVYDEANDGKYYGILSLFSLVKVVIDAYVLKAGSEENLGNLKREDLIQVGRHFIRVPLPDSAIAKVEPFKMQVNLQEAINFFSTPGYNSNKSRLPVTDEDGKIANLASPNMIVKFLAENVDHLSGFDIMEKKLSDAEGCLTPNVQSVAPNVPVICAFSHIISNGFSALGVYEPGSSSIFSVVTLKDFLYVITSQRGWPLLTSSTEDFVNHIRQENLSTRAPTINVSADDTVSKVLRKFAAVKTHRMFVLTNNKITGIVTVSNILKAFAT